MMNFWTKIAKIFRKKEKSRIEADKKTDALIYKGDEPLCFACGLPIHSTHRSTRLQGNKYHSKCMRRLKKLAIQEGSFSNF